MHNRLHKTMIMGIQGLTPEDVFTRFSTAMYEWNALSLELKKNAGMDDQQKFDVRKERLDSIFAEYVTARKRPNGRQAGYNFRNPPEYNPETNEILLVETDGKKAFIDVQETDGFNRKLRYTLQYKDDEWRIDKREKYDDVFKNKWVAEII